jgi:phosphoadenosine phosphosulfate reductase
MTTADVAKPFAAEDEANLAESAPRVEAMSAEEIVRWASQQFGAGLALTVSFGGAGGMVLLDLVMKYAPGTPVLLIDTGVLFEETYKLVEEVEQKYQIRVNRLLPRRTLEQQAIEFGEKLWEYDPNLCCHMRKVEPLAEALKPYRAWMTALRRDQAETRASTPIAAWNKRHRMVKIAPLANWTEQQTWDYVHQNVLPYNELLAKGYTSIGCHTCTRKPTNGDPRSGRWAGSGKTECGLHLGENI